MKFFDYNYWFFGLILFSCFLSGFFIEGYLYYIGPIAVIFSLIPLSFLYLKKSRVELSGFIFVWFWLSFLVYVSVMSGVLVLIYGELSYSDFLDSVYMPSFILSSYFLFYLKPGMLKPVMLMVLFSALFAFYMIYLERANSVSDMQFIQNNWGNVVGASLPFVFLLRNRFVALFLLLVGMAIVFYGLKRSGIFVSALMLLIYFSFYSNGAIIKRVFVLFSVFLMILFFLGSLAPMFVLDHYEFALSRIANISEDGGSGRDRIILSGLSYWLYLDFPWIMFGEGFKAYFRLVGRAGSMHNDFGELLISYGVLGVSLLFFVYFRMFFIVYRFFVDRSYELPFALAIALAFFVYSNVAGVYFYTGYFVSLLVGYAYLETRLSLNRAIRISNK